MSDFSETFENTCRELSELVNSDRQQTHGDFETFLMTYSDMLRAYIGNVMLRQRREWLPEDTAAILALTKVARCANGLPIPAHTLDMAGYGIAASAFSMTFRRAPEPQEPQEAQEGPQEAQEPAAAPIPEEDRRPARKPAPEPVAPSNAVCRVREGDELPEGLEDGTVIELGERQPMTGDHPTYAYRRVGVIQDGIVMLDTAEVERRAKMS